MANWLKSLILLMFIIMETQFILEWQLFLVPYLIQILKICMSIEMNQWLFWNSIMIIICGKYLHSIQYKNKTKLKSLSPLQGMIIPVIISNFIEDRYYFKLDEQNVSIFQTNFNESEKNSILKTFMILHKTGWVHGDPYVSQTIQSTCDRLISAIA